MFPAGYVHVVRLLITERSLPGCQRFIESVAAVKDNGVPPPQVSNPGSFAILKCNAKSDLEVERGNASDVTIPAIRLLATLDRISD